MRDAYKVGVWGPGGLGACAIREFAFLPEFELVSVLAYSDAKVGKDSGELAGCGPNGVKITNSVDSFLAAKPECVVYTPRDQGDFSSDKEVIQLLEAGVNVVTPLPYFYSNNRDPADIKKIQDAAKKGNATLHAAGVSPSFIFEKLSTLLTVNSMNVRSINMREYFSCEHLGDSTDMLKLVGFGSTREQVLQNDAVVALSNNYFTQALHFTAEKLGISLDKIELSHHHVEAKADLSVPGVIDVKKGTIAVMSYKWTGYVDGKPFLGYHVHWFLNPSVRPEAARGDDYWIIDIEGDPSLHLELEMKGSFTENKTLVDRNPSPPGYYATVNHMIQAIPAVIASEAGIMETDLPRIHWRKDFRAM